MSAKNKIEVKKYIGVIITLSLLLAEVLVLSILLALRQNEKVSLWFTQTFSKGYAQTFGKFFSLIPFSVFEWAVVLFILGTLAVLITIILLLCKKKWKVSLITFLSYACICIFIGTWYLTTAGYAYFRGELPLPQREEEYTNAQLVEITNYFFDDFNSLSNKFPRDEKGCVISPYTVKELSLLIAEEFEKWDTQGYLYPYTPIAKPMVNSWLLSDEGITGITFMPTVECNINVECPDVTWAPTIAHELAHAKGVMVENEANMVSAYVLINSNNDFLRYCGYFMRIGSLRSQMSLVLSEEEWADMHWVNEEISKEYTAYNQFWDEQESIFTKIADWFNDLYLKLSNQSGTDSYQVPPPVVDSTVNPDTGKVEYTIKYSKIQKMFFHIYHNKVEIA